MSKADFSRLFPLRALACPNPVINRKALSQPPAPSQAEVFSAHEHRKCN